MARSKTPEPWERQPKESLKAWEAFKIYRDMGADRSLAKVGERLGKSAALMEKWSATHAWVDRSRKWDAEKDRLDRKAQLDDIRKMRKRHADMANAMLIKAAAALKKIPIDEIKASDISRLVDTASKLERISRGDVGEVVEERDGGRSENPVTFYMPDNHRDNTANEDEDDDQEGSDFL